MAFDWHQSLISKAQFESAADCAATRLAAAQGQGAGEAWALLLPGESTPHHQHAIPMQRKLLTVVQLEANAAAAELSPGGRPTGFFCAALLASLFRTC
eukprot:1159098-Pelagomonas_calceolata.AAC.10